MSYNFHDATLKGQFEPWKWKLNRNEVRLAAVQDGRRGRAGIVWYMDDTTTLYKVMDKSRTFYRMSTGTGKTGKIGKQHIFWKCAGKVENGVFLIITLEKPANQKSWKCFLVLGFNRRQNYVPL